MTTEKRETWARRPAEEKRSSFKARPDGWGVDARSEQELLAEILRHVRGVAYVLYIVLGLLVLSAVVGFFVALGAVASTASP